MVISWKRTHHLDFIYTIHGPTSNSIIIEGVTGYSHSGSTHPNQSPYDLYGPRAHCGVLDLPGRDPRVLKDVVGVEPDLERKRQHLSTKREQTRIPAILQSDVSSSLASPSSD